MNCRRYEKWISDEIDRALSAEKTGRLREHLEECTGCRSYREMVIRLQHGTGLLPRPDLRPDFWSDFSRRLELETRTGRPRPARLRTPFQRWAWSGAGAGLLLALGLALWLSRPGTAGGSYLFSFEEAIDSLSERIGENPEIEELFNALIQNSIEDQKSGAAPHFSDEPLIWENLSDEELSAVETALKKVIKS